MKKRPTLAAAALIAFVVSSAVLIAASPSSADPNNQTVLPADGVTSISRDGSTWTIETTAPASEIKSMSPQFIICGVNYSDPCNTVETFTLDAECAYLQVDGIPGHNSSDPYLCHPVPTPTETEPPSSTPTATPTPTETSTPTPSSPPTSPEPTSTPTPVVTTSPSPSPSVTPPATPKPSSTALPIPSSSSGLPSSASPSVTAVRPLDSSSTSGPAELAQTGHNPVPWVFGFIFLTLGLGLAFKFVQGFVEGFKKR